MGDDDDDDDVILAIINHIRINVSTVTKHKSTVFVNEIIVC